jgi:hypothetical protein
VPQRQKRDALLDALRAQQASGAGIDITAAAAVAGLSRPRASFLYHHGLKPTATSPGLPPLKAMLQPERRHRPRASSPDALRERLLGQAERCADKVDRLLADPAAPPQALDAATRTVVALAGAVEKLRPSGKRGLSKPDSDAPPSAPPAPAAFESEAERAAREARIAAIVAEESDEDEPQPTEAAARADETEAA